MSRFVGIDPSLTATGLVELDDDGDTPRDIETLTKLGTGVRRLGAIQGSVAGFCAGASWAAIEGYSYGNKARAHSAGEAQAACRLALQFQALERRTIVVPPAVLKKYVTGNGNAAKAVMLKDVYKRWGFETNDDNIADAYALAQFAREYASDSHTKKFAALAAKVEVGI